MDQPNVGDMRQNMAIIWQDAKAIGYRPDELLTTDMLKHVQNITDLERAKEYIKEMEEREKALQRENEGFRKALEAEKKKVEAIPDGYKALQVDCKQLETRVEYYKDLMKREEERAETYFAQWSRTSLNQISAANTGKTIQALEIENEQLKVAIVKLIDENRTARDVFAQLREHDEATIEEKERQLAAMKNVVFQTEAQYQQLEQESDGFEEAYHDLITRMEDENGGTAAALNKATVKMRQMECVQIAATSEAKTLSKFFSASSRSLHLFEEIFRELLSTDKFEPKIRWLQSDLQQSLDSAGKEAEAFDEVHHMFGLEQLEVDEVRMELVVMAYTAKSMQESLWMVAEDIKEIMSELKQKPDLWTLIQSKFRKPGRRY